MTNKKQIAILVLALITIPLINAFECGNGVCDIAETHYTCPNDCASGSQDNYCDKVKDNICDPDCNNQDPDCEGYKATTPIINQTKDLISLNTIIMLGLLLLALFVIFIILRTINKQKGINYLDIKQRQKQQTQAKQGSAQDPFNKYKYMFKKP